MGSTPSWPFPSRGATPRPESDRVARGVPAGAPRALSGPESVTAAGLVELRPCTSFLWKRLLPQVNRRHRSVVRELASPRAARNLLSARHDYGNLHVLGCYTPGDDTGEPQPSRYCDVAGPHGRMHLGLDHLGWHRWKVTRAIRNDG